MATYKKAILGWCVTGFALILTAVLAAISRQPAIWLIAAAIIGVVLILVLRSPGYTVYSAMNVFNRPADERETFALKRWLTNEALQQKRTVRRISKQKRCSGFCALSQNQDTAVYQVWCGQNFCFFTLKKIGESWKQPWRVTAIESAENAPQEARAATSLFRFRRIATMFACVLIAAGLSGGYVGAYQLAHPERVAMNAIVRRAITAVNEGSQMQQQQYDWAPEQAFENAVCEWAQKAVQLQKEFSDQMKAIGYEDVFTAENLRKEQQNGMTETVKILHEGTLLAERYFTELADCSSNDYFVALFNKHGVLSEWQQLYFGEYNSFATGSSQNYLKAYRLAEEMGLFLQEHVDAFTVDNEKGPVFSDEKLSQEYGDIKTKLQAALS